MITYITQGNFQFLFLTVLFNDFFFCKISGEVELELRKKLPSYSRGQSVIREGSSNCSRFDGAHHEQIVRLNQNRNQEPLA
jgi:hypothetical protein